MLYLHGPTGFWKITLKLTFMHPSRYCNSIKYCKSFSFFPGYLYENSTGDMRFSFTGLTPYTQYTVAVRAKAAGEVGPAAEENVITPAEG